MKEFNTFNNSSLLSFIPDRRRNRLVDLAKRIIVNKHTISDPVWNDFVNALGGSFLSDYKITIASLKLLFRMKKILPDEMVAITNMSKLLNRNSFLRYRDINILFDEIINGNNKRIDINAIKDIFRTLFLIELNTRLQIIYRLFLNSTLKTKDLSHQEKVDFLQELEGTAYKLLKVIDLDNILSWLGRENLQDKIDSFLTALSNVSFRVKRVNFRFTYHCNIECRHCYNASGPNMNQDVIDQTEMIRIIREMPKVNISHLNITGGEPFLYTKTVLSLIREARKRNIGTISIYTNGSWAKPAKKGIKILEDLKNAGFMNDIGCNSDHIKVSAGIFHQEFIPIETIFNLINIYYDMFKKPIIVDYELFKESNEQKSNILSKIEEYHLSTKVKFAFRNILPIGRGDGLSDEDRLKDIENYSCCSTIDEIVFDPDGSARPCCGTNADINGIIIGNIYRENLSTLFKNMQNDPILQLLSYEPIGNIYNFIEKTPKPEGYVGPCAVCLHALGRLEDSEQLKQKLSGFQEYYPFWFSKEKLFLPEV